MILESINSSGCKDSRLFCGQTVLYTYQQKLFLPFEQVLKAYELYPRSCCLLAYAIVEKILSKCNDENCNASCDLPSFHFTQSPNTTPVWDSIHLLLEGLISLTPLIDTRRRETEHYWEECLRTTFTFHSFRLFLEVADCSFWKQNLRAAHTFLFRRILPTTKCLLPWRIFQRILFFFPSSASSQLQKKPTPSLQTLKYSMMQEQISFVLSLFHFHSVEGHELRGTRFYGSDTR